MFVCMGRGCIHRKVISTQRVQVRKHAAKQLYLQLLGEDVEDGALDDALAILSETAWDGTAATAQAARDRLFAPLGVQPLKTRAPTRMDEADTDPTTGRDAGYAVLLTDAARGRG